MKTKKLKLMTSQLRLVLSHWCKMLWGFVAYHLWVTFRLPMSIVCACDGWLLGWAGYYAHGEWSAKWIISIHELDNFETPKN